ncbi:MAG: hypothetical protein U0169_07565 [Polyangiaceae bacterium]
MSPDPVTHEDLRALGEKYREILALREEHASSRDRSGANLPVDAPRERLRALSERFPGALRELDALPLETVRARIELVDGWAETVARDPSRGALVPAWVNVVVTFHRLMRGLLCLKRKYGADDDDAPEPSGLCGDESFARTRMESMAVIRRPPRGRLTDLAFAYLAERDGTDVAAVRELVFATPARPTTS